MKAQMLKIAGVKTEKAFYKKYPTEAAFFKAHPEAKKLVKAQKGYVDPDEPIYDPSTQSGLPTYGQSQQQLIKQNQQMTGDTKNPLFDSNASKFNMSPSMIAGAFSSVKGIFDKFGDQKKQKLNLKQQNALLKLDERLINTPDVNAPLQKHVLDRPENYIASTSSYYPAQGTGYDILRGVGRNGYSVRKAQEGFVQDMGPNSDQYEYEDVVFDNLENVPGGAMSYQDGGYLPMAQDGINNFGPRYDIYSDGGFDSMAVSENIKQYADGGLFSAGDISGLSGALGNQFDNNAGFQAGNFAGQFIPLPGASLATGMIGGALDNMFGNAGAIKSLQKRNNALSKRNMSNSMYQNLGAFSPFRQEGGYVSHDWNPQVIAKFGDHNAEDVYDFAHEGMNSLRSGGHLKDPRYTPVSKRGLETFAPGGELKTHWGGEVKPVSYNPFSEGEGLTYNAHGNSHFEKDNQGRTGIGLSILKDGGNADNEPDVEIETNEPISITKKGAVVYGNLNANKDFLKDFNLPDEFAGKKVKHIVNKIIVPREKRAMKGLETLMKGDSSNTAFGLLGDKTKEIKKQGFEAQLKNYAEQKKGLADLQEFVKNTTDHYSQITGKEVSQEKFAKNGTISNILAKGEIPQTAKNGKTLHKAQIGDKIKSDGMTKEEAISRGYKLEDDGRYHLRTKGEAAKPIVSKTAVAIKDIPRQHKNASGLYGNITPEQFEEYKKRNDWYDWTGFDPNNPEHVGDYEDAFNAKAKEYGSDARIGDQGDSKQRGMFGQQDYSANIDMNKNNPTTKDTDQIANIISDVDYSPLEVEKKKFPWGSMINSALGMFEKPFYIPLDEMQTAPERFSMANNRPEGLYEPHIVSMMKTPHKYSADSDRDAILSQARAASRIAGNNPAAQAAIMAQVAESMNQIGSKELGINQQTEQGVYNENIGIHNQDLARNAAIDLDAMNKYAEARSKTKAQTIEDLKSIAAKQAANKAENMQYNIASAMFPDYTFNSSGKLIKKPRYVEFDTTGKNTPTGRGGLAPGYEFTYDASGNIIGTRKSGKEDVAKEGKTIKAKAQNGNIIKAFKNL